MKIEQEITFDTITGELPISLTNDRLFISLLQDSEAALKQIVCGVLEKTQEEVISIKILNPIKVGSFIGEKKMILDLLVSLNDDTLINLEMQVENEGNWPERTLSYIYRVGDSIKAGQEYTTLKKVVNVGFLNYTVDKEHPEFNAMYQLTNRRYGQIFTDKIQVNVIDLNHPELATQADIDSGLVRWARFFKAKTWEELKKLSKEDPVMEEASRIVFKYINDERLAKIREERAIMDEIHRENMRKKREEEFRQLTQRNEELEREAVEREREAAERERKAAERERKAVELEREAAEREREMTELRQKDQEEIARLKKLLAEQMEKSNQQ